MMDTYDITYDGRSVGTARMEKQGLYYVFFCRCRLPDDKLYRIHVICGENREDLGICVPMDDAFGMDKKIPSKRLGEAAPAFELLPKDWMPPVEIIPEPVEPVIEEEIREPEKAEELFVPVSEEEPFEYLDKLENAVFAEQNGQPGVLINEPEDQ